MYLKYQLHTLKMKECEIVTKHIHMFWGLINQLFEVGSPVNDEKIVLSLKCEVFIYAFVV
jgi:hypothetical protein